MIFAVRKQSTKEEQKEETDALLRQEGDAHSQEPVYS